MSRPFDPADWLERWLKVGGIQTGAGGRVALVADLDGNAETQQRLLSRLDAEIGRSRRDEVRELALERWSAPLEQQ
jgi:hypothetical protein